MMNHKLTFKKGSYPELNQFHQYLEKGRESALHRPYSAAIPRALAYRIVFWSFAALFLILGWSLYIKSFSWTVNLIFGEVLQIRGLMTFGCLLLSIVAGCMGWITRPENDAKQKIISDIHYQLKRIYHRKLIHFGIHRPAFFGPLMPKYMKLKHEYQDAIDEVNRLDSSTTALIDRIAKSRSIMKSAREDLYNQALLKLKDDLHSVVEKYHDQ